METKFCFAYLLNKSKKKEKNREEKERREKKIPKNTTIMSMKERKTDGKLFHSFQ